MTDTKKLPCGCEAKKSGLLAGCEGCHSSCDRSARHTAFCLLRATPEQQDQIAELIDEE